MRVLVTGGAGFIGSHLVDRLIRDGHDVTVIDNLSTGYALNLNPEAEFVQVDIRNLTQIKPFFRGRETVFHLAAIPRIQPSIKNPRLTNDNNITGTLNVLLAADAHGVERVIYSSSSSCETLLSPYAVSKHVGELYCSLFSRLCGLDTVSLRYFNVYGPRMDSQGDYATVIAIFLDQKKRGTPLTVVGDGTQRRDFTHVDDAVKANIKAMECGKRLGSAVLNVGTGWNYSIDELADMVGGPKVHIPKRPGEARMTLADIEATQETLGWHPEIQLWDGLKALMR